MQSSYVALAAALSLASMPALAQQADTGEGAASLPTVHVDMSASPRNIGTTPLHGTVVSADTFRKRATSTSDTAAILADVPGVGLNTGGGFSSMPQLRGLSEQRIRIIVDGLPIDVACPNDMNPPLSYTDPQTLGSIAVVPGVSPVSMGGDNIGGVISVDSAMPKFAVDGGTLVTGEASSFYRSNGDSFGGGVSLTVAGTYLSATYTGSYTQSDDYEGGGSKGLVRSTEYAKTDHALALAAQTNAGLFEVKGGYHFSPYEGFANQWMDMTSNKSWFLNGRYRGVFTWGNVDLTAGYRHTDHEMDFLADKQPGTMPMNTKVRSFTSAAKVELMPSRNDTVRLGADFHHEGMNDYWPPVDGSMMSPDTYLNINDGRRDRLGAFGEWEAHWSRSFSTLIGVRFDRVTMNTGDVQPYSTSMMNAADADAATAFNAQDHHRADNNWSATALASWAASDAVTVELGYAHKTRSPNLYERYSWGQGTMSSQMIGWYGDGNGYFGNLNLKPERADTVSAAVRVSGPGKLTLKISPYYTHVSDYIDAAFVQELGGGFVQLQFANQEAEFYGLDTSVSLSLSTATALRASASYVHGQNLTDGGALYRQMPFNARVSVDHKTGPLELGAELEYVAAKDRVDATRNEPKTDAYALVNLRAAYTVPVLAQGVKLAIEAKNLFDKGYDLPLGGMSLGDYSATGVLRPVSGMGRAVNFGISTKF